MLKFASWNVNSLKVRLPHVLDWIESSGTDVLLLQETKLTDENFPLAVFQDKGWYVAYSGQKTYNGMAVISRRPVSEVVADIPDYPDPQRRVLALTIDSIRFINLYVPNGAAVDSDKYIYKLHWLEKVTAFIRQQLSEYPELVVAGDFNIAPEDSDVHDPASWVGSVLVSEKEREAFSALLSLGLKDSFRLFPRHESAYSWWDYRAASFRRNRGLRIDHILLSEELASRCKFSDIDKAPRRLEQPSDHAPVWVEIL